MGLLQVQPAVVKDHSSLGRDIAVSAYPPIGLKSSCSRHRELYQISALAIKRGDATTAEAYLDTIVLFMLQFAPMKIIRQTERYMKWFKRLKDLKAKARIAVRIRRMEQGDVGEV